MMKTKIVLISLILLLLNGYAQVREVGIRQYYKQGDIELSFFSNIGKVIRTTTTTTTNSYENLPREYTYESHYINLFIGAATGYYILDGLSIEPELNITITESDPSYAIIGNLCYTFFNPSENNYFLAKLGYGWGAAGNYYYVADNSGYRIINIAIGFKARISSSFTYRLELNYRNMSKGYSSNEEYYNYSESINDNSISISAGINFLF